MCTRVGVGAKCRACCVGPAPRPSDTQSTPHCQRALRRGAGAQRGPAAVKHRRMNPSWDPGGEGSWGVDQARSVGVARAGQVPKLRLPVPSPHPTLSPLAWCGLCPSNGPLASSIAVGFLSSPPSGRCPKQSLCPGRRVPPPPRAASFNPRRLKAHVTNY